MQLKPGTQLQGGKYEIVKSLGQGGFGITYLAEHAIMNRRVCIKEFFVKDYCSRNADTSLVSLGAKVNEEAMRRYMAKFIKEAQTVANLSHANIVNIYDSFYENNTAYTVMEYIDGCTLAEWVRDHGPVPEEQAVDYMHQIGAALSYAHAHRVTHLDVKPSNIMLAEGGKRAILIDFGMAKHYSEKGEQTSSTPVGVSHGYAPLEQYRAGGVKGFSPATDIYALGATLYFALTGERPAQATSLVMQDGLKEVDGDFSPSVKDAIMEAMRCKKEDRPQRVEDFLALLEEEPLDSDVTILSVEVEPEPEPEPLKPTPFKNSFAGTIEKPNKKERFPLITTIYLIVGLTLGVVLAVWLFGVYLEDADWMAASSQGWPLGLILSGIGVLVAATGLLLLLCKRKMGLWLFLSGGLFSLLMFSFGYSANRQETSAAIIVGFLGLLFLYGLTCAMLSIKNKYGIRGWKLLKNGSPKR